MSVEYKDCPTCGGVSTFSKRAFGSALYYCGTCDKTWRDKVPPREKPDAQPDDDRPRETVIRAPKGAEKAPLEGEFGKMELARQFRLIYNLPGKIFGLETQFEDKEFTDASTNLLELVNRFPKLRLILRIVGPIAVAGDLIEKAKKIVDEVRLKRLRQRGVIVDHAPSSPTPIRSEVPPGPAAKSVV